MGISDRIVWLWLLTFSGTRSLHFIPVIHLLWSYTTFGYCVLLVVCKVFLPAGLGIFAV